MLYAAHIVAYLLKEFVVHYFKRVSDEEEMKDVKPFSLIAVLLAMLAGFVELFLAVI